MKLHIFMGADINLEDWYNQKYDLYQQLLDEAESIVKKLLVNEKINYFRTEKRVKEFPSWKDKFLEKKYENPDEVLDLAGLRVIGKTLGDVKRIESVVKENFKILSPGKDDKQEELGRDKIGYISIHYTASLSDNHIQLTENKKFTGLQFEIQIRTILQHVWADFEHDKIYKSKNELPKDYQRELYLVAAQLETADRQIQHVADYIEKQFIDISKQVKEGKRDIKINPITLEAYMSERFPEKYISKKIPSMYVDENEVVRELISGGVKSLKDLDNLLAKREERYKKLSKETHASIAGIAIADVYNARDKRILRPKFLRAIYEISKGNTGINVKGIDALERTGLGGYLEGIIPYVVSDLEADGLVESDEKSQEIRLTKKGRIAVENNSEVGI
jgi:putative GTP pyrophosphokinase